MRRRLTALQLVVWQYIGALRDIATDSTGGPSQVDLAQVIYNQVVDLQKEGLGKGIDTRRSNVEL